MAYWLLKSEPEDWSWAQQQAVPTEPWDGVRNHQAANNMRAMAEGDLAFFYHSGKSREIVGIVRIARAAYPDPSDATGKFVLVDVAADKALPKPVSLKDIKADPDFADLALVRQARLSVVPVSEAHWQKLCMMGGL